MEVRIRRPGRINEYAFGTRTATFHVCMDCGVVPIVTSVIDGHLYGIVNTKTFDDADVELDSTATDFEGESVEDRLGRRKRNWIPAVTLFVE